jgi:branched-chain amino acid transport system permease protein
MTGSATSNRPTAGTRPDVRRRAGDGTGRWALVGVAVAVLAALALPAVADAYLVSVGSTALVLAVLALSTQLLTGIAGLPSLGQAAYLAVGGYTAGLLGAAGITLGPVQFAAAGFAGAAAAGLTGPLVLRTRGVAFLMVTFAISELARTVAGKAVGVTGGDNGLHTPPVVGWPGGPPLRADGHVYLYLLGCFLFLAGGVGLLLRTRLVLAMRACADHEPRLAALGYDPNRVLFAGHLAGGAVAGAGGALLVAANRYLSPTDAGLELSALALFAAAIGAGRMTGAVAASVGVVAVRDLLGVPTGGHANAALGFAFLLVAYRRPATDQVRTWLSTRPPTGWRPTWPGRSVHCRRSLP